MSTLSSSFGSSLMCSRRALSCSLLSASFIFAKDSVSVPLRSMSSSNLSFRASSFFFWNRRCISSNFESRLFLSRPFCRSRFFRWASSLAAASCFLCSSNLSAVALCFAMISSLRDSTAALTSLRLASRTSTTSSSASLMPDQSPSVSCRFSSRASTASSSASSISRSRCSRSSSTIASSNSASASSSSRASSSAGASSIFFASVPPLTITPPPTTSVTFSVSVTASCPVAHPATISRLAPLAASPLIVNIDEESVAELFDVLPFARRPSHPIPPPGDATVNFAMGGFGGCRPDPEEEGSVSSSTYWTSDSLALASSGSTNFTTYSELGSATSLAASPRRGETSSRMDGSRLEEWGSTPLFMMISFGARSAKHEARRSTNHAAKASVRVGRRERHDVRINARRRNINIMVREGEGYS
mmetsp:Transcript_4643/g.11689  ORF Transcript_4643/g.11689 Transcript_4643/m.11689 type:complete len:417 (-) Transcript_4643:27-1277(-)